MSNINNNEYLEHNGKHYYKNDAGILLESEDWTNYAKNGEMGIKSLAKQVAKRTKKRMSTIKMPFVKNIQYEVEKEVTVTDGFFIFKSTRKEKVIEQMSGTNVDYKDVLVDGWILKTYYMNVDTVVSSGRIEQEVSKWFYVLKKDGTLAVFEIGYVISHPKTNWETVRFFHELTEEPMTFDYDRSGLGSAYLLDYKPIKWEHSFKRCYNERLYFKRNYPMSEGKCESKGESYLICQPGEGIIRALKRL